MSRRVAIVNSRWTILLVVATGAQCGWPALLPSGRAEIAQPVSATAPRPLEAPLKTIPGRQLLTEQQTDAIEARARFMHGRMLLQRREFAAALQAFQRAWRFNPLLVSPLRDIVPLAASLNRDAEATRYAIIAAEQESPPPALVERVGRVLASRLDFERALGVYRRLLERPADQLDRTREVTVHLEIGRLAFLLGRDQEAADALAVVWDALQPDSDDPLPREASDRLLSDPERIFGLMGEAFLRAGRLETAEAVFRRSHEARPNRGLLGLRLAQVHQRRKEIPAALRELDFYFQAKLDDAGVEPYVRLASLLDPPAKRTAQQDAAAEEAADSRPPSPRLLEKLQQLATADPDNVVLGYFLADQLLQAGQLDEAEQRYNKLLKRRPAADGYRGLARVAIRRGQLTRLLEQLGTVVVQTGSLQAMGPVLQEIAEDQALVQQLAETTRALLDDPQRAVPEGAAMAMTLVHGAADQLDAATQLFPRAMAQPDPGRGPFALGFALEMMARDRPEPAVDALQRIIDQKLITESPAELHHALAGAWSLAEQPDKALAAAREAARLEPDSPRMSARVAWVHYFAKQYDPAEEALLELIERFDADYRSAETRDVLRNARQMLASIYAEQEQFDQAERWLLEILDEFPEDTGAYNDLGYLWADQNEHLQRALQMIREAVQAEPDNAAYRDSLGWVLFRLGRYAEAIQELEQAAATEPVDGVILDHLGDAYAKQNRRADAEAAWQQAAAQFEAAGDQQRLQAVQRKLQTASDPQ